MSLSSLTSFKSKLTTTKKTTKNKFKISTNFSLLLIIIIIIILSSQNFIECWLFSSRIQPYYYPFPYPIPASILSGGIGTKGSSTNTGSYLGQSSIGTNPSGYNYNWYNYQNYPNSGILYPSTNTNSYIPTVGSITNSLFPTTPTTTTGINTIPTSSSQSLFSNTGSLIRSWWTRKFTKFGLLGNNNYGMNQYSPCNNYWTNGNNGSPCLSTNLCCYPIVIQTNVESTQRPSYSDSTTSTVVTYPPNGYVYQPSSSSSSSSSPNNHGFKTPSQFSSQTSENFDDVVDSNQSS